VFVQTTRRKGKREKTVLGVPFVFVTLSQQRFFGFRPQWFDGRKVQITDVEKTIADCLDRPDLCGGVAEAAKGIRIAWQEERLDPQQVVEYAARMGNRAVIKRFGFIVEQLGLASLEETEPWQEALSQGYSPLEPQLPTRGRYDGRWRLRVNLDPVALRGTGT
jgi:predicted transcriptional regulator of viral defense system